MFFISKKELGYVVGYTKFDELDTWRPPEEHQKFNAALVMFENLLWEPNPYKSSVSSSGKIPGHNPQNRILTMYDQNFILAKDCDILSIDELRSYMKNYHNEMVEEIIQD